jgi:hypothetical protein
MRRPTWHSDLFAIYPPPLTLVSGRGKIEGRASPKMLIDTVGGSVSLALALYRLRKMPETPNKCSKRKSYLGVETCRSLNG